MSCIENMFTAFKLPILCTLIILSLQHIKYYNITHYILTGAAKRSIVEISKSIILEFNFYLF